MKFEIIEVNEYFGNNFSGSGGRLEYLPEPELPEEDEEEQLCMRS